jgi:predicted dehydrogenase
MENKIRVGVAGLGFGANFAKIYQYHPHSELYAVCDTNNEILNQWGDNFGIERKFINYQEMLAIEELDAVHIVTPIPDHPRMTVDAFSAGKHVACTVPMATTVEDCTTIIKARRKAKKVYMMMETSVYTREFLYVKNLYTTGKLGKVQFVRGAHLQDMYGWPDYWNGLPPMHYATHAVSPLLALLDKEAEWVVCYGSGRINESLVKYHNSPYAVETAHIHIKDSDIVAEVTRELYDVTRQYIESFDVYGEKLSFEWNLLEDGLPVLHTGGETAERIQVPDWADMLPKEIARFTKEGVYDEDTPHRSFNQGKGYHGGSHPHLVNEFVNSIVENRDSYIDAEKAANWTCAGICAHESALRDGKRIAIPRF